MLWFVIAATVGVGFFTQIATAGFFACGIAALVVGVLTLVDRRSDAKRWRTRYTDPVELRSPFRDAWRVVAGGPDPEHNPYLAEADRYFAYDFLRVDGALSDQDVLAPCDGTVAWTVDNRDDLDNYVSIEIPGAYVILNHLKRGSIPVLPGIAVRAGDLIGRCASSPLLVFAQNRAQMAPGVAEGIPIAFADATGQAWMLEYDDVLKPSVP